MIVYFLRQKSSLRLHRRYLDPNIVFFFGFFGTDATVSYDSLGPHRDLYFGTWDRDPANCAQNRGGGWWYGNNSDCAVWSNLNGIYRRCGNETRADIQWAKLVPTSAKGSAPSSTGMKIRPVDFF